MASEKELDNATTSSKKLIPEGCAMRPQWNSTENSITWSLSFRATNHQDKTWIWAQMFNSQNETRGNLTCYKVFNDQRFAVTKRKQFK